MLYGNKDYTNRKIKLVHSISCVKNIQNMYDDSAMRQYIYAPVFEDYL